ncbi:MAG: hypothetical protein WD941_07825 [Opitutus sp.]
MLAAAGGLLGLANADAQLAATSPFVPSRSANKAPTADAPLEFGGWLETGEGRLYRVIDPARKASTWVRLNELDPGLDVLATQYDSDNGTLTIEHQGRTLTLAEKKAKVVSAGNAAQAMPAPVAAGMAPAVTQSVVLNPTPQDEQRRLEAVAAEVARRRALREQAAQQIGQGNPPQRALPAVAPQGTFQPSSQGGQNQPRGMRRDGRGQQQPR